MHPLPERRGQPAACRLRSRLVALTLVLIGYGSLFPFDYVAHRATLADAAHLLHDWPQRLSTSDVVGNVLLFLPLGLLIPSVSTRWSTRLAGATAAVFYALSLQYLQFWFPSRYPSGADAVFNSLGVVLGFGFALLAHRWLADAGRGLARGTALWPLAAALMLCWVAYRWFPWVPTLDVDNLKHGLGPLVRSTSLDATQVLHDAAAWLLWFRLARQGPIAPRAAVLLSITVVLVEPLFVGNAVTPSNLAGLLAAVALGPLLGDGRRGPAAALALLGLSLLASGLVPYRFVAAHSFLWLPFAGMLSGSMVVNTASLIEKCYLYGGMIVLLRGIGLRWWMAALPVAVELAGIEWLQRSLPGRTAEVTDPLLALLLALCFSALPAGRRRDVEPSPPGPSLRDA